MTVSQQGERKTEMMWRQVREVCLQQAADKALPRGPLDERWELDVLIPIIGANSKTKNSDLRSLFNVNAAWEVLQLMAPLPYFQSEDVLPMSLFRRMHDEPGQTKSKPLAGYVSTLGSPGVGTCNLDANLQSLRRRGA